MTRIWVDADACPVKDEIYRVARRYGLPVTLVSNTWMQTPSDETIELVQVADGPDIADDWIAEHVEACDIVVSQDIPLASRCLEKDALVLAPTGRVFTEDDIGHALAGRELASHLRDLGVMTGGPPPFEKRDRSRFLQALDAAVHASQRRRSRR